MSSLLPVAVYGVKVPAGDVMIPALTDFPATFRITMAAIDPNAVPEHAGVTSGDAPARATLKIVYDPTGPDAADSEDSEDEGDYLKALLEGQESDGLSDEDDDDESSDDDEEKNGGPSDPSKSKKARKEAAAQEMMKALASNDDDVSEDGMDVGGIIGMNGKSKGKGKATHIDDEDEESDDEDDEEDSTESMRELVLCTLDPHKNYQQTLDITVPEDQRAFFKVSGTHAIYLTGNYVIPADSGHKHDSDLYDSEDDEDEYDMSPDEDELEDDEESDELDALEDPRITELNSDDEKEVPKLVMKEETSKKGKNKRAAEESDEESANLDAIMAKSLKPEEPAINGALINGATTNGEPKLSKKQLKKLKNNAGKAVEAAVENQDVKKEEKKAIKKEEKTDKKVQFAKNLEQGPSSSPSTVKPEINGDLKTESKKFNEKTKPTLGPKTVQGVKIDDKKLGHGPVAKKGDKIGMRYIGKLKDGKVFDSNKKGKPFSFKLGREEVIKGWDIGVEGMSAGGERRLVIPANLAYGSKAIGGIPANSELTFDVKLLEIQ